MRADGPCGASSGGGDVGAGAEAGIDEALLAKPLERCRVGRATLRLHQHRLGPLEPEPFQVREDAVDELGPAARLVEILDAQQELAAAFARADCAKHGAVSVAEMQPSGRRRREARDYHACPS